MLSPDGHHLLRNTNKMACSTSSQDPLCITTSQPWNFLSLHTGWAGPCLPVPKSCSPLTTAINILKKLPTQCPCIYATSKWPNCLTKVFAYLIYPQNIINVTSLHNTANTAPPPWKVYVPHYSQINNALFYILQRRYLLLHSRTNVHDLPLIQFSVSLKTLKTT